MTNLKRILKNLLDSFHWIKLAEHLDSEYVRSDHEQFVRQLLLDIYRSVNDYNFLMSALFKMSSEITFKTWNLTVTQ